MSEGDYVLGTDAAEIARLGVQHEVWRDTAIDCWKRAGIGPGSRVVDFGAGPGHAAMDLAELVGPTGEVVAVERSKHFLEHAAAAAKARGHARLRTLNRDLAKDELELRGYDATWCRWVASFVSNPGRLVANIAGVLREGGTAIFHEYADYASWKLAPRYPAVESFVEEVMASWRNDGGEPDIALQLPGLFKAHGLRLKSARPIIWALAPGDPGWRWLAGFVKTGPARLVQLGRVSQAWADLVHADFGRAEANPDSRMLTPLVLEIVAEKVPLA